MRKIAFSESKHMPATLLKKGIAIWGCPVENWSIIWDPIGAPAPNDRGMSSTRRDSSGLPLI